MTATPPSTKDITAWSEQLSDAFDYAASNFSNETELREHVHQLILDAMLSLYGLTSAASAGEVNTKKGGGRDALDRLYGGVGVEWEWDMKGARREHGSDQALNYLGNLRANHADEGAFTAVVADGLVWGFLRYDPAVDGTADLFTAAPPVTRAGHFTWVKNSPGACRQFLELIGAHRQSPITSQSLKTRFGPESDIASRLVTVLSQSAAGRLTDDRTDTLYAEWRRALDVVYGDLDDTDSDLAQIVQSTYRMPKALPLGVLLFVLHTYFALVGRVIAVELLAVAVGERDDAPSTWRGLDNEALLARLRGLERGDLPGGLDITNLFEADLFSWWTDSAESNTTLLDLIRDLLHEISELAFPRIAFGPHHGGDVLRDLYQALIPRELRKALGEFLTPHWLAEACLARLASSGADLQDGRVLDPTCGTGTFIVPVLSSRLSRLSQQQGDEMSAEDVQAVLDSVAGIDLNPVAVTATRVNYVLALGDLATVGSLTLPVWRADSLIIPEPSPVQGQTGPISGILHSQLETSLSEPFTIPDSMNTSSRIAALRVVIEQAIQPITAGQMKDEDVQAAREQFLAAFANEFAIGKQHELDGFNYDDECKVAANLFEQVSALAREGRNGVWARLIENAHAPRFAGKFDVIVGNPPWLTWTKLPDGWRRKSEGLWKQTGLWYTPTEQSDSFSLQTSDIATLVFAVSIMRYAEDGAHVGLLVPNKLINADPGSRAFRRFRLKPDVRDRTEFGDLDIPFRTLWVDDWSKISPFAPDAANNPIFLVTKRGEAQETDTPGGVWTRIPGGKINPSSWRITRPQLNERLGSFAPVDPSIPTSAWRFQDASRPDLIEGGSNNYTFGTGLHTRGANGIFFVNLDRYTPAAGAKKATIRVENDVAEGRNRAAVVARGEVEIDLVYPVLRGRDVQHWVAKASKHIVLPHDPGELDHVLTTTALRREYPKTLQWLSRNKLALSARHPPPPAQNWNMGATGDDWCRIAGALQHMLNGYTVVVRELSERPAAALAEEFFDRDLRRQTTPLVDHKLMLCTVPTRDEALYLVAMINSTPMQDLLESFVNSTAVSPTSMKRLPIADYEATNGDMIALVAVAGTIVGDSDPAAKAVELQSQVDTLVLKIVAAGPNYQPQPVRRKRTPAPRPAPAERPPTLFDS